MIMGIRLDYEVNVKTKEVTRKEIDDPNWTEGEPKPIDYKKEYAEAVDKQDYIAKYLRLK